MVSEEKSKYVSANRDPGPPSCFSNPPEKHNLGRGLSDLASCQVLLNSIQRFQVRLGYCFTPYQRLWLYNGAPLVAFYNNLGILRRRSRKCLSKSEDRVAGLFLQLARKHKLSRGRWDLASCKVFVAFCTAVNKGDVENVPAIQRLGWPFGFSDLPEKHKLGRGHWDLASCQVSLNSV